MLVGGVCVVGVKKCNLSKCCSMYPDNSSDTPLTAIVTIVIKVLLHSFILPASFQHLFWPRNH